MELTQQEKLLINAVHALPREWSKPHELIGSGDTFIGYEVSARASEAQKAHPELWEGKREGKYMLRRVRVENARYWLKTLAPNVRMIVEAALQAKGVRYFVDVERVVVDEATNTARIIREVEQR